MSVPDTMKGEGNLKIELNFKQFADFHPEAVVQQVPRLQKLLEARLELRDLLAKLDGNDELGGLLANVVSNTDGLKQLRGGDATAPANKKADPAPEAAPDVEKKAEDPPAGE
jgi:type VI secretion system protein ImpB